MTPWFLTTMAICCVVIVVGAILHLAILVAIGCWAECIAVVVGRRKGIFR